MARAQPPDMQVGEAIVAEAIERAPRAATASRRRRQSSSVGVRA